MPDAGLKMARLHIGCRRAGRTYAGILASEPCKEQHTSKNPLPFGDRDLSANTCRTQSPSELAIFCQRPSAMPSRS